MNDLRWLIALVLILLYGLPSSAQPITWADTSSVSVARGLELATAPGTDREVGAYLIYRAGRSGNESFLPQLKEIFEAERWSGEESLLASAALRAIDDLGDVDYLLDVIARWRTDINRAASAIGLLAAPPRRELLRPIAARLAGAQNLILTGAMGVAAEMVRADSVFAQASPEERVEIAVEAAGWVFSKSGGNLERELTSYPMAVAGRAWLRQASDENPTGVAAAILVSEVRYAPELNEELHQYLAQFTNEEVRTILGY